MPRTLKSEQLSRPHLTLTLPEIDRVIEALRFELRHRSADFICGSRMDEEEQIQVAQLIVNLERQKRTW